MGMYDQLTISKQFELPLTDVQMSIINQHLGDKRQWRRVFQTKDLSCWLDYYTIDASGKLYEIRPGGKREFFDLTGDIRLYEYINSECVDTDLYVDFKVVLIKGVVDHVQLINFRQTCNKERKTFNTKMEQAATQAMIKRSKLHWKIYNVLWGAPVDWLFMHVGRFGRWLNDRSTDARRVLLFWN